MRSSTEIIKMVRGALAGSVGVVSRTDARIYTDHPKIKLDATTGQVDLIVPCAIVDAQGGTSRQRNLIASPVIHLYAYAKTGLEATELVDAMIQAVDEAKICSEVTAGFPVTGYNPQAQAYFARVVARLTVR